MQDYANWRSCEAHTEECQCDLAIACKNMPLICARCQGRAVLDWYKLPCLDAGFRFMKAI